MQYRKIDRQVEEVILVEMVDVHILKDEGLGVLVGYVANHEGSASILFDLHVRLNWYPIEINLKSGHLDLRSKLALAYLLLLEGGVWGVQCLGVGEFVAETIVLVEVQLRLVGYGYLLLWECL
jgi:hypothetical protein